MCKTFQKIILLLLCVFFALACGGGGGGGSSNTSSLENDSLEAFQNSNWSDKTPATPDSYISVKIGDSVQSAANSITTEVIAGIETSKSSKSYTFNQTVNGPLGGTALITGTYTYESTQGTVYPIQYTYDFKIVFNNYIDSSIAINGEITYTGTSNEVKQFFIDTEIEINGGYSVLYQDRAYNIVSKLEAAISHVNQASVTDYTYTVNGITFSGTY